MEKYISDFRTELLKKMPFYGDILSHLNIVENNKIETAATDGRTIYYNRDFFETLERGQRNYVLLHELFHVLLLHFRRRKDKDEQIWNVAADYVVNGLLDSLERYNLVMNPNNRIEMMHPPCGCFLEEYNNQSVEQLYNLIYADNKNNFKRDSYLIVKIYYNGVAYDSLCKLKVESGDMDLIINLTDAEQNQLVGEINNLIDNAMKNWSNDSSMIVVKRQLSILMHERRLDWKTILKRYLNEASLEDTSYDHPERKYLHMDMIIPGASETSSKNNIEDVWAFIDTSGSITDYELNMFITQLYYICHQFNSKINIGFWDVNMNEVYMNADKKNITECISEHSGGTDANAVYDFLAKNKIKPRVMLILTDGYFNPVDNSKVRKYKDKTIVVLSQEAGEGAGNLGKIARL